MAFILVAFGIFYYQLIKPGYATIHEKKVIPIKIKDSTIKGEANING